MRSLVLLLTVFILFTASCGQADDTETAEGGDDNTGGQPETDPGSAEGGDDNALCPGAEGELVERDPSYEGSETTITLVAHDSFAVSDGLFDAFTDDTGIEIDVLTQGDTGELVATSIITAGDDPVGDVIVGVDNTFACRAVNAGVFVRYVPASLTELAPTTLTDPAGFLTPVDVSDVCVNYWVDEVAQAPTSLHDLTEPAFADLFVTQNPETSAPGFAFLLATIAEFGDDWQQYWLDLRDNGVLVTSGWNEAYYEEFVAGGGERPIVTSYASSPPAEVVFADPPIDEPPTAAMLDSCYRQYEFAGIAAGTEEPQAAALLIEFLLSETYQADLPLNQFVYPVRDGVQLPEVFTEFGPLADDPALLDPAEVEENRDEWTAEWVELVLG